MMFIFFALFYFVAAIIFIDDEVKFFAFFIVNQIWVAAGMIYYK